MNMIMNTYIYTIVSVVDSHCMPCNTIFFCHFFIKRYSLIDRVDFDMYLALTNLNYTKINKFIMHYK